MLAIKSRLSQRSVRRPGHGFSSHSLSVPQRHLHFRGRFGFTFVELSLAILFVSLLSITVVVVANSILAVAEKGLSIKTVNSVGSDLIDELSTAVSISPATSFNSICDTVYTDGAKPSQLTPAQSACRNDQAFDFVFSDRKGTVKIVDSSASPTTVQLSGLFCTGKYSYVWNTGYTLSQGIYTNEVGGTLAPATVRYMVKDSASVHSSNSFRLLRFEDANREICASRIKNLGNHDNGYGTLIDIDPNNPVYDFSAISFPGEPVELIPESDNNLALYNFYVAKPSQDTATSRTFYAGSFVLATLRGGVNISSTGDYCQLTGQTADIDYCAVNKFNFAAQALGK